MHRHGALPNPPIRCEMDVMEKKPQNRIRELRRAKGLSLKQLAELAGTTHQTVQRLETGERRLSQQWMERLASALGIKPADLLPRAQTVEVEDFEFTRLRIFGEIQAGKWRRSLEISEGEWQEMHVPRLDKDSDCFGVIVRGNSMNQVYPDGTILICVPIEEYDHVLAQGSNVIIERRNSQGMTETTVKELRQHSDGSVWLWPRSSDPLFQEPLHLPRPDTNVDIRDATVEHVKITAVVVGSVRPETPKGPAIVWT